LGGRSLIKDTRLVFTADVTYRKGKAIPLKPIVDQALATPGHVVEHVIVLERSGPQSGPPKSGPHVRDMTWEAFLEHGRGHSGAHTAMEANEAAFILATSGTTARPKLAIHTHGGYQVHIASMGRWCFGLTPEDVWWSTSDIG